jgi:predicted DsbA family dithiol-disulfide isomerase
MRTHATAIRSTGENSGDKCERDEGDGLASMRTHATAIRTTGDSSVEVESAKIDNDVGDYWLPWHIDSQFITLLTCDEFYNERTSSVVTPPSDRNNVGLQIMNRDGDVVAVAPLLTEDVMLVQMGGFAQIYSGGLLTACRHSVLRRSATPGIARATYCNFWYAPWDEICTLPAGGDRSVAVNSGWNALMDDSYIDISMMLSFYRFREFFTQVPVAIERRADADLFASLTTLLPSPSQNLSKNHDIVVDVLTDLRCPFSHIALCRLQRAIDNLKLSDRVSIRYHPVFLDPSIPEEGEDLDTYLKREHSMTLDDFFSPTYALMKAANEVDVTFSRNRRVVNTLKAFAAVNAVSNCISLECGHSLFTALSKSYFEEGVDVSNIDTIIEICSKTCGFSDKDDILSAMAEVEVEYNMLASFVTNVPCLVLRQGNAAGAGTLLQNIMSVEQYQEELSSLLKPLTTASNAHPSGLNLLPPAGVLISAFDGNPVRITNADPRSPVSLHTRSRHGYYPKTWPFIPSDFSRIDETPDGVKYSSPRMVTHMDSPALRSLTKLYDCLFNSLVLSTMSAGRKTESLTFLDMCGSWNTFYPVKALPKNCAVIVQGLNAEELAANKLATQTLVHDLNVSETLPIPDGSIDFISNVASIEYMQNPVAVLAEAYRLLRPGGVLVVAFSNRCFDDKAVAIWLRRIAVGAGLVDLVATWLHFAAPSDQPWANISSLDLSPSPDSDPLYALVAVKEVSTSSSKCVIN